MILYFTGTGNSKFIADALAEYLSDEVVSINDVIREGKPATFTSDKPYIVVAPIYAWQFPKVVQEFLKDAIFQGSDILYCVESYAQDSCDAARRLRSALKNKGMNYKGCGKIKMPSNYITGAEMQDVETIARILKTADRDCKRLAMQIKDGGVIYDPSPGVAATFKSTAINSVFYAAMANNKSYTATDACTSCGTCVTACPFGSIALEAGRPVWNGRCTACYACIHHCPQGAVEVSGKTEGKPRYLCPDYKQWKSLQA